MVFHVFPGLFRKLQDLFQLPADILIVFPAVGAQAIGAVFDAAFGIGEVPSAPVAQGVQGTIAEQAAEGLGIRIGVAGEVFTFPVLKKIVMTHWNASFHWSLHRYWGVL